MAHFKKNLLLLAAGWGSLGLASPLLAGQAQDYEQAGMALFRAGQYEKSIGYFDNAVKADPNDAQAYEDRGDAYMKLGDKANALSSYQSALALDPGNPTLQTLVESLDGQTLSESAPPQTTVAPSDADQGLSAPTTVYIEKRRRFARVVRPLPNYNDGLPLMDHAPVWYRLELAYNYSQQGDLKDSAQATNDESANGDLFFGFTNAQATASSSGIEGGGELGFLLNPMVGIALGARVIESSDYNLSAYNSAPSTVSGAPHDFENATFSPYVVPLTLDAYLFMPDKAGRFFLSGGLGYYFGVVAVNENYSLSNYNNDPNAFGNPAGNLYAGNIGFQVGVGRDFALSPTLGFSIFAHGRFAKISGFQGALSDGNNWELVKYADHTVDIDNPGSVGSGGTQPATLDFTGFDIGMSLNFYSF